MSLAGKLFQYLCLIRCRSAVTMGFMRPGISRLFVAVVVLGCGGATCLYSGAGPIEAGGPAMRGTWNPALAFIADLLTVPIPTAGIADVRDIVLVFTAGVVLLLAGFTKPLHQLRAGATKWMGGCAAIVIALSIVSALAWRSFDLSWGWIVRFAAGAALAIVISHRFTPAMVRQSIVGLLTLALLSLALTIWHRADRGYAHFSWPIGPITIVGGLAAVWAALAGVWGVGLVIGRGAKSWATAALGASALCLYALQQTERRSPVMGLVVAVLVIWAVAVWRTFPNKKTRIALCATIACASYGAIVYVISQSRSPDREKSGPIAVRRAYWEQSARFVGQHPLLGIGPDRFVIDMTMAIAPLRAEMPHVYHGNLDTAAHNEWLQAAVELGVPGGLAYVMLPLGVLFLTLRSQFKSRPTQQVCTVDHSPEPADGTSQKNRMAVAALAAALIALIVCEAASINLRGPIFPIWCWTLIGLLAAGANPQLAPTAVNTARPSAHRVKPLLLVGAALTCLTISFREIVVSALEAAPLFRGDGHGPLRLSAEQTLHTRYAAAAYASDARYEPNSPPVELWREVFDTLPVYRDAAARYANELIKDKRSAEAKQVLDSVISGGISPYDISANVVYYWLSDEPVDELRCIQRALRSGAVAELPDEETLANCLNASTVQELLEKELPSASTPACEGDEFLRGARLELWRANAIRLLERGNYHAALENQKAVADCYRNLERTNNPYRRAHAAEADAFYKLSYLYQEAAPNNYKAAYDAIVEAERYAVLGIKHEKIAHPDPTLGFVGGEVVPTEFPERLRPLWKLSAWLHLAVGDFRNVDLRILASLPPDQWNAEGLKNEKVLMAAQVYTYLRMLSGGMQPPYLEQLRDMGREAIEGKNAIFHDGRS